MSLVSSKIVETNRVELVIEVKGEVFTKAVDASYRKNSKNIALPGFRKGKAPRAMVERAYGKGAFYDDAVNELYPPAYSEAAKEAGIEPVDQADVEIIEISDEGFSFKATVTTKPEVKLGAYKGIEGEMASAEVTEEDIDAELVSVREKYARVSAIEGRAAKDGDIATIDFEGFCDGEAFEGGKGENYPLPLGSNTFIPGFEEKVIAHNVGEEFDVDVVFPEEYAEKTLAGKPATFKVKIHELKERLLPELDDEFAKDASEFDTLKDYKADIKAKLSTGKEKEAKDAFEGSLMEAVVNDMTAEIPDCMFLERMNEMAKDFAMRLSKQGIKFEDFIRYTGETTEKFMDSFRPQAVSQVKTRLAMEAVAVAESLSASAEEVENEYKKLAEAYKAEVAELRGFIPESDIIGDIACRKALDFIVSNAKVVAPKKAKAPKVEKTEKAEKPAKASKKDDAGETAVEKKPKAKKTKDAQ